MSKKISKPKKRNAAAAALASPLFKQRVVKDRTKFTRKVKHKGKTI